MSERVVFTNGCFDLLHCGHLHFLEAARSFGDYLVVGLNSDATIRGRKGKCMRPLAERKAMLEALRCVDEVRVFHEPTAVMLLHEVLPHLYVTGEEYRGRSPEVSRSVELGIPIWFVPRIGIWSTTNEMRRVVA